jgi:hypothetical protein
MTTDKQLTANDIKGDLAQRTRCQICTRNFSQVVPRIVQLDKKETVDGNRRAVSAVCEECEKKGIQPAFAYRKFIASDGTVLLVEQRVEDLPDFAPASARSTSGSKVRRGGRRSSKGTRGTRANIKKTTPTETPTDTEGATAAAKASITTLE